MNIIQSDLIYSTLINAIPFMLLSLPFLCICYFSIHTIEKRFPEFFDSVFIVGIMLSVIFVLSITIFPDLNISEFSLSNLFDKYQRNIIPLNTLKEYYFLAMGGNTNAMVNIIGNAAIFIPIGFFVSGKIRNKVGIKTITICFIISLAIEILQTLFSRYGDVDDIIINTVGGYLGYLLFNYLNVIFDISGKLYKIQHNRKQLLFLYFIPIIIWSIFIILIFCKYSNIKNLLTSFYS